MAAVQILLVKKLQTKLQGTCYTILKYKNEIMFAPNFIFIGFFFMPLLFS